MLFFFFLFFFPYAVCFYYFGVYDISFKYWVMSQCLCVSVCRHRTCEGAGSEWMYNFISEECGCMQRHLFASIQMHYALLV